MEFVYIGFSDDMLKNMLDSRNMELMGVITRPDKLSEKTMEDVAKRKIPIAFVETKEEIKNVIKQWGNQIYIMYHFNIILPKEITNTHTIINIHSGDLRTNRGKNPISWSILLEEKNIIISIHQVSGDIDMGKLISQIKVPIQCEDNYLSLNKKVADTWNTIESTIISYLNGDIIGEEITEGIYRRAICEDDYTINLGQDTEKQIIQKIKSQIGYCGAVINCGNLKLYVHDWKSYDDRIH